MLGALTALYAPWLGCQRGEGESESVSVGVGASAEDGAIERAETIADEDDEAVRRARPVYAPAHAPAHAPAYAPRN